MATILPIEFIDLAEESIEDIAAWIEIEHVIAYVDGVRRVITSMSKTNGGASEIKNHTAVPLTGLFFKRRAELDPKFSDLGVVVHLFAGDWALVSRFTLEHGPESMKLISLKHKEA